MFLMVDPDFDFTDLPPSDVRVGAALSEIGRRGGRRGDQATVESHSEQMRRGGQATVESHGE